MARARTIRLALAQINTTVGDLEGNARLVREGLDRARAAGAHVVAFPELTLPGYPPEDLLMKPRFVRDVGATLDRLARDVHGVVAIVGTVDAREDVYNAAAVIADGEVRGIYRKTYLPNYGVFDEARYFQRGRSALVVSLGGVQIGITICEDVWYPGGPIEEAVLAGGAEIVVNISSSPYHVGKRLDRERMLATRASDEVCAVAFVNLVGGQDELVFDGGSLIANEAGRIAARGRMFEEDFLVADIDADAVFRRRLHDPRRRAAAEAPMARPVERVALKLPSHRARPPLPRPPLALTRAGADAGDPTDEAFRALVLGTRDYVRKNRFESVVLGISGGIDSALTAAIATEALGPAHVIGLRLPSRYTCEQSMTDADALARALGIRLLTIPIQEIVDRFEGALAEVFHERRPDVTEENIQARARGTLLMAVSNKFGWLVLTTGNKSEMSTGYCTLYGDMAGGFAVLKDVPKTQVYALSRHVNARAGHAVIPESILTRPPSAELAPDQRDEDSLPPYEILDPILRAYVEEDRSVADITALGFPEEMVRRVARMVDASEYKRRQGPPGIKISVRAFGKDRRLPITNRYLENGVENGAPAAERPAARKTRRPARPAVQAGGRRTARG